MHLDQWYLVTVARENQTVALYINGNPTSVGAVLNQAPRTSATFHVGVCERSSWIGDSCFNGNLDQIATWNRVLIKEEVEALYNSGSGLSYDAMTGADAGLKTDMVHCIEPTSASNWGDRVTNATPIRYLYTMSFDSTNNPQPKTSGTAFDAAAATMLRADGKVSPYSFTPCWNDVLRQGLDGVGGDTGNPVSVATAAALTTKLASRTAIRLGPSLSSSLTNSHWTVSAWIRKHGEAISSFTEEKIRSWLPTNTNNVGCFMSDYWKWSGTGFSANFIFNFKGNVDPNFRLWNL
jgi:hypothetical protein